MSSSELRRRWPETTLRARTHDAPAVKVLVTGLHGLIRGELLGRRGWEGHEVTRLVRSQPGEPAAGWGPPAGTIGAEMLEGHDATGHLAAEGIGHACWTEEHKGPVLESRVFGTGRLAGTLTPVESPPYVLVSGLAVSFAGDGADEVRTEEGPPPKRFVVDVVRARDAATGPAEDRGVRVARLRTGLVLTGKAERSRTKSCRSSSVSAGGWGLAGSGSAGCRSAMRCLRRSTSWPRRGSGGRST